MFVGRLTKNKRPGDALTAFGHIRNEIPRARLWMVGEGKLKNRLREGLPEGAELFGRIPRDELLERMSRAHLVLATSVREGWGLVVTEANALGTPAVGYDVPGLRDSVLSGKTGLLTPPAPEALAAAAISLLNDPDRYARIRHSAIEWGSAHSWERTATELFVYLREAVNRAKVAAAS
jgi:glycosyltransferase involved in cell wall biosynthesis